ncbi:MAG: hypothetical protein GC139_10830 [Sideroxydans sp.]|nr:hypothetical protein [Sideroxydans sp.]
MIMHSQAVKKLSPEDYRLIEDEHLRLHELLNNLRSTCCNLDSELGCQTCTREKMASCFGQLTSFFYNLINHSDNHFKHEEAIMLKRPEVTAEYEYFRDHRQAHHAIMKTLESIVSECMALNRQGNTAEGYRQLYNKVLELFREHDRAFDDPFIQSTRKEST